MEAQPGGNVSGSTSADAERAGTAMRRPYVSVMTVVWVAAVVGALFTGMAIQQEIDRPISIGHTRAAVRSKKSVRYVSTEIVQFRDGSKWQRFDPDEPANDEAAAGLGTNSVSSSRPRLQGKLP
ncbi:MAG TPA: hypothetical protein VHC22_34240 [Pirellulales bacterium]|nr:hypothetical protein [Pirellulales bacterium]